MLVSPKEAKHKNLKNYTAMLQKSLHNEFCFECPLSTAQVALCTKDNTDET